MLELVLTLRDSEAGAVDYLLHNILLLSTNIPENEYRNVLYVTKSNTPVVSYLILYVHVFYYLMI